MTPIRVAAKIWMKAVLLLGISVGLTAVIALDFFGMLLAALAFFFGFTITVPLLPLILVLINITKRLSQYSIQARLVWLTFYLIVLFYLYYLMVLKITSIKEFETFFNHLIFFMAGVLPVAVFTNRRSLYELYEANK
ncbi:hypothetical protein A3860_19245 [Niastella vici]|uniref:Uncharacterized protein n=2 Tax=Niastella vici TaxID=1703345 RepID=A0A1V9G308_9BACT|nr:hypothetical protein A3860_19245 [Niastella vici]